VGRPGVTALLVAPFDTNSTTRSATLDAYNAASDPAAWSGAYRTGIARSLAVWDALDATCGNQLFYPPGQPAATSYDALATLLADDRLVLRADQTNCSYLGVEIATAAGQALPCGGRPPGEDAVDRTYALLVATPDVPVGDGVSAPADSPSATTFPFLASPR
jgi:hypothetical protein